MDIKVRSISTDWSVMPGGLTWYFIGQPKTGKTTAASGWSEQGQKGVLLLDTDLGVDFVDGANTVTVASLNPPEENVLEKGEQVYNKKGQPQTKIVSPEKRGFYHRIGKNKGKPMEVYSLQEIFMWLHDDWDKLKYDTVVIDTIDEVNGWIEKEVTKELNIDAMGEGQWGADWGKARRRNIDIVKRFQGFLKSKGAALILISHSKSTQIQDSKVQLSPDLPRGLAYALTAKADVIGYCTADKDSKGYYISFQAYDERTVGSRLKPLAQKTLELSYESIKEQISTYEKEESNAKV
jgi:hypothetical protein|tara:strand:+ start:5042 stop:5923 length:882 start_codon:yes stop_codon:yes gene_type:complete